MALHPTWLAPKPLDLTDAGNAAGRDLQQFSTKTDDDFDFIIIQREYPHFDVTRAGKSDAEYINKIRVVIILRMSAENGVGPDYAEYLELILNHHLSSEELRLLFVRIHDSAQTGPFCIKAWSGK